MKQKKGRVVSFHTLGCKLNQAETEALASKFIEAGFSVTSDGNADVCVLNTCTVTHIADRKSRHLLRLLRKRNPDALIIATGCYAQNAPQELAGLGVNAIVGNDDKMQILDLMKNSLKGLFEHKSGDYYPDSQSRVRSFVKIQDGCSNFCSYCIVPMVRGSEFCIPADDIVDTVQAKAAAGYKEVILTGTKIGGYCYQGIGLKSLILRTLAETDIPRLHLSSLQPQEINDNLLDLWGDKRLCRHFHVALQSGSDSVLKRMGRLYSCEDYNDTIAKIRRYVPDSAVTTDVMVGFPGESEQEFEESYHFCKAMRFANIHVFSYSRRSGTRAADMTGQVDAKVKKKRSLKMLALSRKSVTEFNGHFLGRTLPVLWEAKTSDGEFVFSGLTDNYIRVYTQSRGSISNLILPVRLSSHYQDGLWGELQT